MGSKAVLELFKCMDIASGHYTEAAGKLEDTSRVSLAEYKSTPIVRKRRKVIRGLKKQKEDKTKDKEGLQYGAGEF